MPRVERAQATKIETRTMSDHRIPRMKRAQATKTKTKTLPDHMMRVSKREKDWSWPGWTLVMIGDQTRDHLTSVGKRPIMEPRRRVATWATKRILRNTASHKKLASRIGK